MDWITPLIVVAHMSDPTASTARDCSSDFAGAGISAQWRSIEFEGALGKRRMLCGSYRETTTGGYAAIKWRPLALRRNPL